MARRAIRVADLAEPETLADKLDELLLHHNTLLRGLGAADVRRSTTCCDRLLALAPQAAALRRAGLGAAGRGAPRRPAHPVRGRAGGACSTSTTAPIPTSPHPTPWPATAASGAGIGPAAVGFVLGIAKAYTHARRRRARSRPSCTDETGTLLGERGHEFGTVTGRRRRCGWFDAALVRQAVKVGGIQGIALTKLDVLDGLPELKHLHRLPAGRRDAATTCRPRRARRPRPSRSTRPWRAGRAARAARAAGPSCRRRRSSTSAASRN